MLLLASVSAAGFVEGDFLLDDSGNVAVSLESDYDLGLGASTSALTNKKGEVWSFVLSEQEVFDSIILEVCLPRELVSLEGVKSNLLYRVHVGGRTCLEFLDADKPLEIEISYVLRSGMSSFVLVALLLGVGVAVLAFFLGRRRKKGFSDIEHLIGEQEKMILDRLMKGPARQKYLRKELDLPKASFSRYLHNLEKKKLLVREGEGKNKMVRLK